MKPGRALGVDQWVSGASHRSPRIERCTDDRAEAIEPAALVPVRVGDRQVLSVPRVEGLADRLAAHSVVSVTDARSAAYTPEADVGIEAAVRDARVVPVGEQVLGFRERNLPMSASRRLPVEDRGEFRSRPVSGSRVGFVDEDGPRPVVSREGPRGRRPRNRRSRDPSDPGIERPANADSKSASGPNASNSKAACTRPSDSPSVRVVSMRVGGSSEPKTSLGAVPVTHSRSRYEPPPSVPHATIGGIGSGVLPATARESAPSVTRRAGSPGTYWRTRSGPSATVIRAVRFRLARLDVLGPLGSGRGSIAEGAIENGTDRGGHTGRWYSVHIGLRAGRRVVFATRVHRRRVEETRRRSLDVHGREAPTSSGE